MAAPDSFSVPLRDVDHRERTSKVLADIAMMAVPSMFTNLLGFVNETTNALFIGHHGSREAMAAVGIGNMMQNCFGLSIGIGLTSAMDTLVSQAHGAGEDRLASVYLQRARLIAAAQMVWILPLMIWCDRWLVAIGQDPEVAALAAEYNSVSAPFLLCFFYSSGSRRFLSAFLRPKVGLVVAAICAVCHPLWCWIFVALLGLGNRGLGLANGATWTLRALLFSGYLWRVAPELGLERRWVLGFQREAFQGWASYMKVALPALLQTCSEWWLWEICALVVGYLGSEALAAHVTTSNFMSLCVMMPLGVSSAAATLVGNALGASRPALARQITWCCWGTVSALWILLGFGMVLGRQAIAEMYTKDAGVQRLVCVLLILNAVSGLPDSGGQVMSGACRGMGKLRPPTLAYLVSYYMLMLPAALLFAFPLGLGIQGIYYAMILGTVAAGGSLYVVVWKADWASLAAQARERISRDNRRSAGSRTSTRELQAAHSKVGSQDGCSDVGEAVVGG